VEVGRRTPWYIFGMVLLTCSFLPLFHDLDADEDTRFYYYVTLGITFSIGWASMQVSHMSLVPSLTHNRQRRVYIDLFQDKLNNLRTLFVYGANFAALCFGVVIFQIFDDPPF